MLQRCIRVILAASVFISTTPLPAQQVPTGLVGQQQQHAAGLRSAAETGDSGSPASSAMPAFGSKDTYRWEGAVLGGVLGALMFGYMGLRVCYSDCVPSTAAIALTGGVLGGFTGMMIGGLFSKHPPVRDQDGKGDE